MAIEITINGSVSNVANGTTVAAAVLSTGLAGFRNSLNGEQRSPLCGMGVCFECRLIIDGQLHEKSCQIEVRDGMRIETDE